MIPAIERGGAATGVRKFIKVVIVVGNHMSSLPLMMVKVAVLILLKREL